MQTIDTFQNRLKKAMSIRNIKQVDLVNKTNLDKTLINKYLSGASNPRQRKLTILADALDVNEIWLMGYDVPMERELTFDPIKLTQEIKLQYGENSIDLLNNYSKLNALGKQKVEETAEDFSSIDKYIK